MTLLIFLTMCAGVITWLCNIPQDMSLIQLMLVSLPLGAGWGIWFAWCVEDFFG